MSLEIAKINNKSNVKDEFVRLRVTKDTNLKDYAILDNTYLSNGNISNIHRHIYRFPDAIVSKGDYVRLYSGTGVNKKELSKDKDYAVHYFYWGSKSCVWNDRTGDVVELVKIQSIGRKDVPESE